MNSASKPPENQLPMAHDEMLHAPLPLNPGVEWTAPSPFPSLPARNEWGESRREGNLNKTHLLSPALSCFLRQEERGKCPEIGHPLTCVDTNAPCNGERIPRRGSCFDPRTASSPVFGLRHPLPPWGGEGKGAVYLERRFMGKVAQGRERGLPANPPIIIDNPHETGNPRTKTNT
jgi:hypothetical protein